MDLVALSFWYSQNAVLSAEARRAAFITNNVLTRIFLIGKSLDVSSVAVLPYARVDTNLNSFKTIY